MWTINEIEPIQTEAVQKRIPFTIGSTEIANFIGNLLLVENFTPTTTRAKYILQAIIREVLINRKLVYKEKSIEVPAEIQKISANETEKMLITADSIKMPDICHLVQDNKKIATIVQIHPQQRIIKGICITDFGLDEKQTIHLGSQQIMRIPIPQSTELQITLALTQGFTLVPQRTPIVIPESVLGLIIDTRDSDILINSGVSQAKELISGWMKSLDLIYNEG
jgi:hypothetical protein